MKNNNILVLLISTLGVGILCAIVASIAFTYYNGGFDELGSNGSAATLQAVADSNQQSPVDPATVLEAVAESAGNVNGDYIYLVTVMQKFQTCNTNMIVLDTAMATVQVDPTILDDEQHSSEIQAFLEDVETNCAGLGDNDDLPDTYADINKSLSKAENSIDEMVENYQDYFTYKKSRYLEKAEAAYEEAMEYMQSSSEILQEAMLGETP